MQGILAFSSSMLAIPRFLVTNTSYFYTNNLPIDANLVNTSHLNHFKREDEDDMQAPVGNIQVPFDK